MDKIYPAIYVILITFSLFVLGKDMISVILSKTTNLYHICTLHVICSVKCSHTFLQGSVHEPRCNIRISGDLGKIYF